MKTINTYIIEKLKLSKDSKSEEKIPPKNGDTIVLLLKTKYSDRWLTVGHIINVRKNKENKLEEFQVEYANDMSDKKKDWFFYINDEKKNFIGVSEIPLGSVYSCDFALKEINRMLEEKDNKFDNHKLGYPRKEIEYILICMRDNIKYV